MNATAEQLITSAEGDIGKSRADVGCPGTSDWCAWYMSNILARFEYDIFDTFVTPFHTKLINSGLWQDIDHPERGAYIFIDWNHLVEERPLDHVGIISSVEGNTIKYVNGNAGEDRSVVSYSTLQIGDPDIIYYTQLKSSGEFYTDKCVYDVSYAQSAETVQALCNDTTTGGLILRFAWNDELDSKVTGHLTKCKAANIPVGFYSASNKNITADGEAAYKAMLEAQRDLLNNTLNITANDCLIGIWLDLETWGESAGSSGCGISATPDENVRQIELFREVFGALNFPVLGFYCNRNELSQHLVGASTNEWKTYPFWYSRPGASRSTVDSELSNYGITNAYVWQDGFPNDGGDPWAEWWSPDKTYVHKQIDGNWLDNDTILKPIPTSGGGGGGTVSSVTVSVVDPKRIYFSPTPTVFFGEDEFLDLEQEITITTDAENAEIYYTLDGSSPYEYQRVVGNENWQYVLSSHAVKYTEPIIIKTDTHLRVIAVPSGTTSAIDPLLAKGSGTYLFNFTPTAYSWDDEQYAYRLMSEDKKVKYFEENRQAFLRYHAEETTEEILYNTIIAITEQGTGTVQPDSGDVEEGGHAGDDT